MDSLDYISFCKRFFAATGIPVNLLYEGRPVYAALGELISFQSQDIWEVYPPSRNPEFGAINPDLEYAHVRIEGTGYDLFLGPIFTSPVSDELVKEYFEDSKIPPPNIRKQRKSCCEASLSAVTHSSSAI